MSRDRGIIANYTPNELQVIPAKAGMHSTDLYRTLNSAPCCEEQKRCNSLISRMARNK
jgi:hypothetical protein